MPALHDYITLRYPNWLDYARHHCKLQHLEGWEEDLLNEIIIDLLRKPAAKTEGLIDRKTKKIVNNTPTTELDKFVLTMIKVNASSKFANFRKNVIGQKVIGRMPQGVEVAIFTELTANIDFADESTYNPQRAAKLDAMHLHNIKTLRKLGYTTDAVDLYVSHYIEGKPVTKRQQLFIEKIKNQLLKT